MSYGLTPYDFVQQVFYQQEKVILDFRPDDDKYKEVLMEGNFVLQELQKEEDWSWLRKQIILGSTDCTPHEPEPEYIMPDWVYKPATLHGDGVRLYRRIGCGLEFDPHDFISVPWVSTGTLYDRDRNSYQGPAVHYPSNKLGAVALGNTIVFSRPLMLHERNRIAVCDVQERIPLLHICSDECHRDEDGNCQEIEDKVFTMIPDPNYVVFRTAALHAEGSPPAQHRAATLQDAAQKLLSAMRQNDTSATEPDYIEWDMPFYIRGI